LEGFSSPHFYRFVRRRDTTTAWGTLEHRFPLFNDKFIIHGALLLHHSNALHSYNSTNDYRGAP